MPSLAQERKEVQRKFESEIAHELEDDYADDNLDAELVAALRAGEPATLEIDVLRVSRVERAGHRLFAYVTVQPLGLTGRVDLNDAMSKMRFADAAGHARWRWIIRYDPPQDEADWRRLREDRGFLENPLAMSVLEALEQATQLVNGALAEDVDARARVRGEIVDLRADVVAPEFVVDGLIAEGQIALLVDDEGQGKSWLAHALAAHCSEREDVAGRRTYGGGVVLLDGQLGAQRLAQRFRALYRGMFEVRDEEELVLGKYLDQFLQIVDCRRSQINLLSREGRLSLMHHAERAAPVSLLIIDTRDQFVGDADVNDPRVAEAFFDVLREFQAAQERPPYVPQPAVLVLVNARKRAGRGQGAELNWPSQRVPGSTRWKDLADTILTLKVTRTPDRRTLDTLRVWAAKDRDDIVQPLTLKMVNEGAAVVFRARDETDSNVPKKGGRPAKIGAARELVLQALADGAVKRPSLHALARKEGIGGDTLDKAIDALEAERQVRVDRTAKPHSVRLAKRRSTT